MVKLIIEAEEKHTPEAIFIALGRQGLTPTPPGYTISLDGEVLAVVQDPDEAVDYAADYRDRFLGGNAIIIER